MEFIIEVIMEFFIEIFAEVYVGIAVSLMPNKTLTPKAEKLLETIFAFVGIVFFLMLLVGIVLIIGNKGTSFIGWIFVCLGVSFIIISLILKYISSRKYR